jgi:outer membrane protein assembly factor BamB
MDGDNGLREQSDGAATERRSGIKAWVLFGVILAIVVAAIPVFSAAPSTHTATGHMAIPAGVQDWPMWRQNAAHIGVSSETTLSATSNLQLHWSANTANTGTTTKSYSSPAVVFNSTLGKSLVYVGNQQGEMRAYDAATGAVVWSYAVPKTAGLSKEIEASPAVSNGVVYFGVGDWHEYALNATTGLLICKSQSLGGITAASPTIANPDGKGDVVYFGDAGPNGNTSDGGHEWAMYGVGNTGGTACATKWMYDAFGSPAGSQTGISGVYSGQAYGTLANGTPVVTFGSTDPDDSIYEVNANTGAALWRFQTPVLIDSDVGAPSTIAEPHAVGAVGSTIYNDGAVFETAKSSYTYGLDLQTGTQLWVFYAKKTIGHGNPAQSGATLVGGTIYLGYGGGVFSLDAATGTLGWKTILTAGVVSSPAVTGPSGSQVLLVGDIAGNVHAFRLSDGASLFTYSTGALIFASAAVSTGQFFISSSNGLVYAFGL